MTASIPIAPVTTITDLETLKVISDPLRMRILDAIGLANSLGRLCTVKQIAAELDSSPAKLYYHIGLLEKHGLITIAETRVVSGIIEKQYRITAHHITVDRELLTAGLSHDDQAAAVMAMLDSTLEAARADVLRLMRPMNVGRPSRPGLSANNGQITRENTRISAAQAERFNRRLMALMEEFREMSPPEGEDGEIYALTLIFNPVPERSPADRED